MLYFVMYFISHLFVSGPVGSIYQCSQVYL